MPFDSAVQPGVVSSGSTLSEQFGANWRSSSLPLKENRHAPIPIQKAEGESHG